MGCKTVTNTLELTENYIVNAAGSSSGFTIMAMCALFGEYMYFFFLILLLPSYVLIFLGC